jgi:oxygen-independent coproporphyrinogen III oxidase
MTRQLAFNELFLQHTGVEDALLERYNLSGPRYTSYPTAPVWQDAFNAPALLNRLTAPQHQHPALPYSLYIHLPFCESRCHFCACNVVITKQTQHAEKYLELLFQEIELLVPHLELSRPVMQFHLGGGTPTYLSPQQLERLWRKINQHFTFHRDAEISLEADPRVTTEEHLQTLARLGFNRISLGVQDVDPTVQAAIARVQSVEETQTLIDTARAVGFEGVNVDLIYGLPHQSAQSFYETVATIISLNPDRLAVYNYAHVPWMAPWQSYMNQEAMPKGTEKYAIFRQATKQFLEAGYVYIGMDHYAKPDDEMARAWEEGSLHRNFMGYTVRAGQAELVGLGLSAISSWKGHYSQNVNKLSQYEAALGAGQLPTWRGYALSEEDLLRQAVIMQLMCQNRLDFASIDAQFGITFETHFAEALNALKPLEADGLLSIKHRRIEFSPLGRIFSRNIAMPFDAYLQGQIASTQKPLFSKTL